MSLLETIDDLLHFDYNVTFKNESFGNFSLHLSKDIDDKKIEKFVWSPNDHLDEETLIYYLKCLQTEIQKEFKDA